MTYWTIEANKLSYTKAGWQTPQLSRIDVPYAIPLQSGYKHDPSLKDAVESKFNAKGSVQPLHDEFQSGLDGSFGITNISVGPNTNPSVSFMYVGTWVTKLYTYANWHTPQLSTSAGPPKIPLQSCDGGNNTASITWTTPLSANTSATVTIALSIYTPVESIVTLTLVPSKVVTNCPLDNIDDITLSPTTWCSNISVRVEISFNSAGTVPGGKALKAASVGANNVNGPGPDNVELSAQVSTATSKVVWSGELDTIS